MKTEELKCDGACSRDGECKGIVQRVRVSGIFFRIGDSMDFNYCETAIATDRENGFTVDILE